ncbi:MAG: hypothetical protein U1E89_21980 [Burkholderiaceae bacterium]
MGSFTQVLRSLRQACGWLVLGALSVGTAQAQLGGAALPKPGSEQPRADVTRKVPGAVSTTAGPGTQTEDDIYIGRKLNGGAVARPAAKTVITTPAPAPAQQVVPLQRSTTLLAAPGTKGAVKPPAGQRARATGDEDEMDDLDIQRRKAQGLPDNKPSSPKGSVRAGGESPQTERR